MILPQEPMSEGFHNVNLEEKLAHEGEEKKVVKGVVSERKEEKRKPWYYGTQDNSFPRKNKLIPKVAEKCSTLLTEKGHLKNILLFMLLQLSLFSSL